MQSHKRIAVGILGIACMGILAMFPVLGYAQEQEGEAVNADSILVPKEVPITDEIEEKSITESSAVHEGAEKSHTLKEKALAEVKAENEDDTVLAKKIVLAENMHKIRPTREQVDAAVRQAAMNLPEYERKKFIATMKTMLNYNAIERISIDAMVEVYSLKELESMVEYFTKSEARTASKKIVNWAEKVQPEIIHMIDRAMMRVRTGQ